jgi:lipopolysaccharide transport system ATP-binding protein
MAEEAASPTSGPLAAPGADPRPVVLTVSGVGKRYRIYDRPPDRLKQMLLGRFGRRYGHDFSALHGASFDLRRGETLGILGRNGSGKSTLLQIIAGTLAATTGEVRAEGRVAALLELGSGFNPEFTGRENIFLNAAILGLSREETRERFDEIVAFADIGEFIDQPVKVYSSGMMVRLAFAVATSVDAEILLIDEALAVGDVFFQQKCYRRLHALRERGVSIVLVSHSPSDIEQFCERAVLLHHGNVVFQGPAPEAVKRYYLVEQQERTPVRLQMPEAPGAPALDLRKGAEPELLNWPPPSSLRDMGSVPQVSDGGARCTGVVVCDVDGRPCVTFRQGETASFFYEFELLRPIDVPVCGLVLQNARGVIVHGKNTLQYDTAVPARVPAGTRLRVRQDIRLEIFVGQYTFEVGLAAIGHADYERRAEYVHDDLYAAVTRLCHVPGLGPINVVVRPPARPVQLLHHGVANLPGRCQVAVSDAATREASGE